MTDVILVRHAMPAFTEQVPAHEWRLGDEGLAAADALAARLPPDSHRVASDEPKAWQTIAPLGALVRDPRFGEVRRVGEPWNGPYMELRRAYVDGVDHPAWEPRADVVARFEAGFQDHLVRAAGRTVIIATHGMAMTLWLTAASLVADPGEFWSALQLPDALRVDLVGRTVSRL